MIRLLDHTYNWRLALSSAAASWHDAGYPMEYVPMAYAVQGEEPIHDEPNIIVCTDGWPAIENWNAYSDWVPGWNGLWHHGWSHFIVTPASWSFSLATAVHEIGHALGLVHPPEGFTDTVMTPVPSRTVPTGYDLARATTGWVEPPVPTQPPKKKKKHKRKKH